ncbi:MAG: tetratricopeptide repeat protein [Planctomycetes bacterium]|nr:tetratricopeptide repeat protein [Planctomycetota bacterium]
MHRFSPHPLVRSDAFVALALVALAACVYLPAFWFDFVNYDDPGYVTLNPHILGGPTTENLWWALTTFDLANWHPLTWVSLQFDAAIWGANPAGFHLTNLLLHAINTALLYLILRTATGAVGRSVAVAAVWGLHPLHVESVAWVTERKDVLCTLFWFLTMLAHVRYAAVPSWGRYLTLIVCCALALASKPLAVTLPFALLLFDLWPLGRVRTLSEFGERVWEKWPLFVLVVAACVLTFSAQAFGGAVHELDRIGLPLRVANVIGSYATYLGQTMWPTDLVVFYSLPKEPPPVVRTAGLALLLLGLTVPAVALYRRAPYLLIGWLWFLGTFVPMIGIVHVGEQSHADRYTYVPHVGLFLAMVWGLADLAERLCIPVVARYVAVVVVVALLAVATRQQLVYWRDGESLWARVIAVDPENVSARIALGKCYLQKGESDTALELFEEALRKDPDSFEALMMRARVLLHQGRWGSPK